MPTIEIVSIGAKSLNLDQGDFNVAIIEENELKSHRALFNEFLRKQQGVIAHIGNPNFKDDKEGGFWAEQIIDWSFEPRTIFIAQVDPNDPDADWGTNQQYRFQFLKQYIPDIDSLLKKALDNSPIKKVYFLTDYQFGPASANQEILYTIEKFWAQHDREGLTFNTMYELYDR